jgi:hypothetical protein
MITQAEPHQYRQRERSHRHPYEHPQVEPVSLGHFVCTVFIVIDLYYEGLSGLALIWLKELAVSRRASSLVSSLAALRHDSSS